MSSEAPDRLEVGRVGKPHGLKGDVTVVLVTDRAERTEPGARLFAGARELVVDFARAQRGGWILHFAGVDDRDAAESLRGAILLADPIPAGDDELWVHDLIGCEVRDRAGRNLGTVGAVEANPAHDLLVLDTGGLVPMPFVVEHREGHLVVDPPAGLLDP